MPTATDFKMKEGEFSKNVSLGIIYFYIANSTQILIHWIKKVPKFIDCQRILLFNSYFS